MLLPPGQPRAVVLTADASNGRGATVRVRAVATDPRCAMGPRLGNLRSREDPRVNDRARRGDDLRVRITITSDRAAVRRLAALLRILPTDPGQ